MEVIQREIPETANLAIDVPRLGQREKEINHRRVILEGDEGYRKAWMEGERTREDGLKDLHVFAGSVAYFQ